MALTEWPTKTTGGTPSASTTSTTSCGVALEPAVPDRVVRRRVGAAGADVVEQDDPADRLEGGCDEPPHPLVAAEAVGEDQRRAVAAAGDRDVVAGEDVHVATVRRGAGLWERAWQRLRRTGARAPAPPRAAPRSCRRGRAVIGSGGRPVRSSRTGPRRGTSKPSTDDQGRRCTARPLQTSTRSGATTTRARSTQTAAGHGDEQDRVEPGRRRREREAAEQHHQHGQQRDPLRTEPAPLHRLGRPHRPMLSPILCA